MGIHSNYSTLFSYHFDTVLRLLDGAGKLSKEGYHDNPGFGHGSLHELFFHLLVTDCRWRTGMETGERMPVIRVTEYPDFSSIQAFYQNERKAWMSFLESLPEEDIESEARMVASNGEVGLIPRWRILTHVVLHGMQHAAEIAEILTLKGQSPGNIDFIFYD
jgi:uncharacterized damage-inducible protein DinB